jgi:hypothetical protein
LILPSFSFQCPLVLGFSNLKDSKIAKIRFNDEKPRLLSEVFSIRIIRGKQRKSVKLSFRGKEDSCIAGFRRKETDWNCLSSGGSVKVADLKSWGGFALLLQLGSNGAWSLTHTLTVAFLGADLLLLILLFFALKIKRVRSFFIKDDPSSIEDLMAMNRVQKAPSGKTSYANYREWAKSNDDATSLYAPRMEFVADP